MTENLCGCTKGSIVEEAVERNFKGETTEVGLYLAMARQAQQQGYPEVAAVLKDIAWEEAAHATRFAELNGKISLRIKENLEKMLSGELAASDKKAKAAQRAKEAGCETAYTFFRESSQDEARHAGMLKGLLERYFSDR